MHQRTARCGHAYSVPLKTRGPSRAWCPRCLETAIECGHPAKNAGGKRSRLCRKCAGAENANAQYGKPVRRACAHCGENFTGHILARYCSKRCGYRASYLRRRDEVNRKQRAANLAKRAQLVRTCKECSGPIGPERSLSAIYCSRPCSNRASRHSSGRTCQSEDCDRPEVARGMCMMHYRRWARANGLEKSEPWTPRRQAHYDKRRAAKYGAGYERFDRDEIFTRDNWTCGLCSEPVDPELAYPDPMSASLDHIVPLSLGGPHSRLNVQCSHLACNVAKGNRVAA